MRNKKILCVIALGMIMSQGIVFNTAYANQVSTQVISTNRLAGENRYDTSVAISKGGWTKADTVILACGDNFADALCAGPLAKKYNAPILLIPSISIGDNTLNELLRLKTKNIILVGGTSVISPDVEKQLNSAGYTNIDRIGGKDRYETSAMIAERLDKTDKVALVSGDNFPDALSIASVASKLGMPILLSNRYGLSEDVKQFIESNDITQTYIVGGDGILSSEIEKSVPSPIRLSGSDRYGTNLAVIKQFDEILNFDNIYLVLGDGPNGDEFADALSASALACNTSSPMIITNNNIDDNINTYIKTKLNLNTKVIAIGGQAVIPDTLLKTITDEKISVPVTKIYDNSGTYSDGEINGSVIISAAGVYLKNTSIKGDLLIASTVNDGNIDLDNVTVAEKTIINGGGAHSDRYYNGDAGNIYMDKPVGEETRLVIGENASFDSIAAESNCVIDASKALRAGKNVVIGRNLKVKLIGEFDSVVIKGLDSELTLENARVNSLEVSDSAENATIMLSEDSIINKLTLNSSANMKGNGKIENAFVYAAGSIFQQRPTNLQVLSGVSVNVSGGAETGNPSSIGSNNGSTGSTSGDGATGATPQISPRISSVAAITDMTVVNGTTLNSVGLPNTVNLSLSDNSTTSAAITWDGGSPAYNGNTAGTYIFTGIIIVPTGVTNPNNVSATVKVNVGVQVAQGKIISSVVKMTDINVANGTLLNGAGLPSTVNLILSDNSTTSAAITWDGGSPVYNGNTAGTYIFTGIIIVPTGVTNPNNVSATVKVNVGVQVAQGKIISSVVKMTDINIANGTLLNSAGLPSTVNLILSDSSTTSAAITWDGGNPAYNGSKAGTYEFIGIITVPTGITNPNNVRATVRVNVGIPVVAQEKTIISAATITNITVANGTALNSVGLPNTLDIILSDNSTTSAAIAWDGGNPVYNGNKKGTYEFTGTITVPIGVINTNNISAKVRVNVDDKIIISAATINDITVVYGTVLSGVGLPSNVNLALSDNSTTSAAIAWDGGNPAYNGNKEGTYEFTGTITVPTGVINLNNISAKVRVNVDDKIIISAATINDITVVYGTALNGVGLPSNVNLALSDNSTTSAAIAWDGGNPAYNGNKKGTYEFTGTITVPTGVTNTNNVSATVKVEVAAPVSATGMTVKVAAETIPKDGKVMLTVTPTAVDVNHKIYYRLVDAEPTVIYVGTSITAADWIEVMDINAHEISVIDGKYIEVVEVTNVDGKVTKWGESGATDDNYSVSATPTKIFWVDYASRQIFKADLDGSNPTVFLSGLQVATVKGGPVDIAVDNICRRIYWRTGTEIRKINFDGTGYQVIISNIPSTKGGLALDVYGNKLYLGTACTVEGVAGSKIYSVDLNNPSLSILYQGINVSDVTSKDEGIMDLKFNDGKLYWSTSNGLVKRADLAGGGVVATVITDTGCWINGIAIDASTGKIYWAAANSKTIASRKIGRAGLDGSSQETLISGTSLNMVDEYDNPMHVAVGGGKVYFTTNYSKLFKYDGFAVSEVSIPVLNSIPEIYQDGGIALSWE